MPAEANADIFIIAVDNIDSLNVDVL